MSSNPKRDFKSAEFDGILVRWIANELSESERSEWVKVLTYDSRFREDFCDWMKSLRRNEWMNSKESS